jgi:hypothetical protein
MRLCCGNTVFTRIFVRNEHARKMKFPFKHHKMMVCTLGGDQKEIDGMVYRCRIKDLDGKVHEFQAHGMDQVTGDLGHPLNLQQVKQLFPHIRSEQEGRRLINNSEVDYLIGLGVAGLQPTRTVKTKSDRDGKGDLWLWQNQFGSCVRGSHSSV